MSSDEELMGIKDFAMFRYFLILGVIFNVEKVSTSQFDFELKILEDLNDLNYILEDDAYSVVYPNNIGHWYGTENNFLSCIKFNGAMRILVPVLLPNGISETFPLDIPPAAIAEGRCINNLVGIFFREGIETTNSILFRWQSVILETGSRVTNEFSIDFKQHVDQFGNPVYSISNLYVTYYNSQFVSGMDTKKILLQMDNLNLFPVSMFNSFICQQGELVAALGLFHVHFYNAQWQAFSDFLANDDFNPGFTSSDCIPIPSDEYSKSDDFWKLWIVCTIIVLIVCLSIAGIVIVLVRQFGKYCGLCCVPEHDEGYETFA